MPRPAAAADGVQGHPQQERRKGRGEVERGFRFPLAALLAAVFFFFSFARRQHRFPPVVLSLSLSFATKPTTKTHKLGRRDDERAAGGLFVR